MAGTRYIIAAFLYVEEKRATCPGKGGGRQAGGRQAGGEGSDETVGGAKRQRIDVSSLFMPSREDDGVDDCDGCASSCAQGKPGSDGGGFTFCFDAPASSDRSSGSVLAPAPAQVATDSMG